MKTIAKTIPALLLALAACGDDGGGGDDVQDPDANAADVQSVTCAGATIAVTFTTTSSFTYEPTSATISAGEIVQFMPAASHDVASDDGLFSVGFGGNGCFQFNTPGTYQFRCTPHQFTGQVIVQ